MDFLSLVENLKTSQFLASCCLPPRNPHICISFKKKKGQKLDWPPLRSEPSTIGQAPTKQSSEGTGQMHVAWALPETKKYNDPTENKF